MFYIIYLFIYLFILLVIIQNRLASTPWVKKLCQIYFFKKAVELDTADFAPCHPM